MSHHVALHVGHIIGEADTEDEAKQVCLREGFTPLGNVTFADKDLGPEILKYEPDGRGVWIVDCDL
ncbi:MAG TPA: hypothetical protein VNQ78_04865 [Paracoccus sp. (in: a-proteobacteria)]|uniref:hypothetical protein n=1 Tax=Paracoccus sp. TaxID=267 RepID=UPI002C7F724B|nr:hypothetical protein [Paracoccus sp. (in: a-proteobacteria)]HWL55992.1 hypothetical protein [Paracoccus sp. (in: a-proteobacteria)]